ncbi:hypothetical protein [Mycolicibacterium smegmatis]|uniref:hypothetical protein n=1 Tax=Mycolicibacterium smegmatis TaxID=1772 RepID=UPI001EFBAF62|nr:hypothetical protein [Mycolicibacterium smegmatis]ULN33622.1 hypothetical protein KZ781_22795 [Mycolicibacterium smegmatis]
MSRTPFEPPAPARHRPKPSRPTVTLAPHTVSVIGQSPICTLVLDCGSERPAYMIELTTDLAAILRKKLNDKRIGERL